VYLEAAADHMEHLFKDYISHPKPVIWGNLFAPHAHETPQETLRRCYPALLDFRARRYKDMAHITIPYTTHRAHDADLATILG
jgi:hypothetical protein